MWNASADVQDSCAGESVVDQAGTPHAGTLYLGSFDARVNSNYLMAYEQASARLVSLTVVQFLKCPMQVSVCWRMPKNHTADTFHLGARHKKVEPFPFCRQFPSRLPLKMFIIHRLKIHFQTEVISAVSGSCRCSHTAKVQLTEPSFPISSSRSGAASAGSLSSCSTGAPFLVLFSVPPQKFKEAISDKEDIVLPVYVYCYSCVLALPLTFLRKTTATNSLILGKTTMRCISILADSSLFMQSHFYVRGITYIHTPNSYYINKKQLGDARLMLTCFLSATLRLTEATMHAIVFANIKIIICCQRHSGIFNSLEKAKTGQNNQSLEDI